MTQIGMTSTKKRPRIKVPIKPIDWIIECLGLIILLVLIIMPIYYYNSLPDEIPTHFGINGHPDNFGGRSNILTPSIIGFALFVAMSLLNRYPHIFNYPVQVTEDNAERLYRISTRAIRILKLILMIIFGFIGLKMILISQHQTKGLGGFFAILVFSTMIVFVGLMIYKMNKNK
jgi:uncharacterized membrane protein